MRLLTMCEITLSLLIFSITLRNESHHLNVDIWLVERSMNFQSSCISFHESFFFSTLLRLSMAIDGSSIDVIRAKPQTAAARTSLSCKQNEFPVQIIISSQRTAETWFATKVKRDFGAMARKTCFTAAASSKCFYSLACAVAASGNWLADLCHLFVRLLSCCNFTLQLALLSSLNLFHLKMRLALSGESRVDWRLATTRNGKKWINLKISAYLESAGVEVELLVSARLLVTKH